MSRPFLIREWVKIIWTYQSRLSEELSIKRLRSFLKLTNLADCFISLGVVFHNFIPRNMRAFCHFDFVYRESTSLLFTLDLVSCSCAIICLYFFLSEVFIFAFTNNPKHYAQNKIIIHTFELDKCRTHF